LSDPKQAEGGTGAGARGAGKSAAASRPKRKLLTVIESLGRGGAERLIVTTHALLDRARYEPVVAALCPPYHLAQDLEAMGVRVHRLDTEGPRDMLSAIWRLRRVMRKERPDVVHTHLFGANLAGRLASPRRARVITSLHNPDYSYEDNGTRQFRVRKALDRWSGNRYNRLFIAVSEAVKADYELHTRFSPIRVLPNYLDLGAFRARLAQADRARQRLRLGVREDELLVLHVGRFHRQKAQDLLLEAFAEARIEDPRLRLCLVGEGPELPEARALAQQLNLEDAVMFTGALEDTSPMYAAADMFVFPSRWEAFGIALLEAMAAGLPVVATQTGGILELVSDGTGMLIPTEHVTPLASAIVHLARDPEERARLGAAAARRASDFDAAPSVRRLEALYDHA
jgi:glycosyltransferase involved in cell wall biosynthesis